jgi:hypothetical protein
VMVLEGNPAIVLRRKAALMGGPAVSARESGERENTGARGNGPTADSAQARKRGEAGMRAGASGPRAMVGCG